MKFHLEQSQPFPTEGQVKLAQAMVSAAHDLCSPARLATVGEASLSALPFAQEVSPELRATMATFLVRTLAKHGQCAVSAGQAFEASALSVQLACTRMMLEETTSMRWVASGKSLGQRENRMVRLLLREFGHRDRFELADRAFSAVKRVGRDRSLEAAPPPHILASILDDTWKEGDHPWAGEAQKFYQLASYHVHHTLAGPGEAMIAGDALRVDLKSPYDSAQALRSLAFACQLLYILVSDVHLIVGLDDPTSEHARALLAASRAEMTLMELPYGEHEGSEIRPPGPPRYA